MITIWIGQPKIMVVEMVTKIWSPFFNCPKTFMFYLFIFVFLAMTTKFKLLDYDKGLYRSTEKVWLLRWQSKFGCHFLTIQKNLKFFFCTNNRI